jgi:hypothetical protein
MTEFKEYLRSREMSEARREEELDVSKMTAEWTRLKNNVRALADGETYKGDRFEWSPYSAPYTDFVRLGNVAAIFRDSRSLPSTPLACEVFIGRKPLAASEMWVEDEAPAPQLWHLEPRDQNGQMTWQVKELRKTISTEELANTILLALVRFFDDYAAFYRTHR